MSYFLKNYSNIFHYNFKSNNYKEKNLYNSNHPLSVSHKKRKYKNASSIKLPIINSSHQKKNSNTNIKKENDILLFDDLYFNKNNFSLPNSKKIIFDIKL